MLHTIIKTINVVLRTINLGFVKIFKSSVISWNFNRRYIPAGISQTNIRDANVVWTKCWESQHSLLQSISKNTIPLAFSVHINISINIEIDGIYIKYPSPIHRISLMIYIMSKLRHYTFRIKHDKIVDAAIEYDMYIYIYNMSSERFRYITG